MSGHDKLTDAQLDELVSYIDDYIAPFKLRDKFFGLIAEVRALRMLRDEVEPVLRGTAALRATPFYAGPLVEPLLRISRAASAILARHFGKEA